MNRQNRICATCEEWSIKDDPEAAARGIGRCRVFEQMRDWDFYFCVLYAKAKNMSRRTGWIQIHLVNQQPQPEETKDGEHPAQPA